MADIRSLDMETEEILVNLKISENEYSLLELARRDLLLLPTDSEILDEVLTTGKLGNGNRIMLPNRLLKRHGIAKLRKKTPAKIFERGEGKFLLIKLEESTQGVPVFEEENEGKGSQG